MVRQLVELSAEGYGKASATITGSTVSVDVHAASLKEFRFEFAVKHAFISAYADEVPIITTRGTKTKLALKMGEPFVVGALLEGSKGEADQQAYVMVVKLTD